MTRPTRLLLALSLVSLAGCSSVMTVGGMTPATQSPSSAQLHDALRKLWSDHVVWTRLYIIAAAANDASASTAAARLMRNQEDMGNAIVP
jgi:uncharacterized protein YceK